MFNLMQMRSKSFYILSLLIGFFNCQFYSSILVPIATDMEEKLFAAGCSNLFNTSLSLTGMKIKIIMHGGQIVKMVVKSGEV